ncbi:hypothetical protein PFISCL1PPCAC_21010 [Pristionchus fissidentatus]|uniref:Uncharacterized protein n=1 Tax=Pristionchus fissidentatus TaxID=1538716 RepID=A0AAV5WHB6_9BILA|nr:hypothetical protein PFISCL1PPCAC_21010 [Pristionchus fissidentatus]
MPIDLRLDSTGNSVMKFSDDVAHSEQEIIDFLVNKGIAGEFRVMHMFLGNEIRIVGQVETPGHYVVYIKDSEFDLSLKKDVKQPISRLKTELQKAVEGLDDEEYEEDIDISGHEANEDSSIVNVLDSNSNQDSSLIDFSELPDLLRRSEISDAVWNLDLQGTLSSCQKGQEIMTAIQNGVRMTDAEHRSRVVKFLASQLFRLCKRTNYPNIEEMKAILIKFMSIAQEELNLTDYTVRCRGYLTARLNNARKAMVNGGIKSPLPKRNVLKRKFSDDPEQLNLEFQNSRDGTVGCMELMERTRDWRVKIARTETHECCFTMIRQIVTMPNMILLDMEKQGCVNWDTAEAAGLSAAILRVAHSFLPLTLFSDMHNDDEVRAIQCVIHMLDKISASKRARKNRLPFLLGEYPEGTTVQDVLSFISRSNMVEPTLFRVGMNDYSIAVYGREIKADSSLLTSLYRLVALHYFFNIRYNKTVSDVYHFLEIIFKGKSRDHSANARTLSRMISAS